jgi:hypothetical protein
MRLFFAIVVARALWGSSGGYANADSCTANTIGSYTYTSCYGSTGSSSSTSTQIGTAC